MLEYKIIEKISIKELEAEVTKEINKGWKLEGGVALISSRSFTVGYVQALSKKNGYPNLD
jgi:hypothetical protein